MREQLFSGVDGTYHSTCTPVRGEGVMGEGVRGEDGEKCTNETKGAPCDSASVVLVCESAAHTLYLLHSLSLFSALVAPDFYPRD